MFVAQILVPTTSESPDFHSAASTFLNAYAYGSLIPMTSPSSFVAVVPET
jgi:hypothetical protein